MPRRIQPTFQCRPLADLTRQLLVAPLKRRAEQVRRAEKLHDQLDPAVNYPLEFIQYRITGYRGEGPENSATLLVGQAVLPDLRQMIDTLSHSMALPPDEKEPAESPEELAKRLDVAVKTLTRWRALGLRWRWVKTPGARYKKVVYPRSAVEHFLAHHAARVQRAAQFTQIDPETRKQLLERARQLAQGSEGPGAGTHPGAEEGRSPHPNPLPRKGEGAGTHPGAGVSLNRVAAVLAKEAGRPLETLRQLLERHDRRHPKDPIFAVRSGPLTAHQKRLIARAYRMGVRVSNMARHFQRTRACLYHVIRERRAAALQHLPLTWFELPTFRRDDADAVFLAPLAEAAATPAAAPPDDEHQHALLVRLNYLKFKAAQRRGKLDRLQPSAGDLDRIEELLRQAGELRQKLTAAALPTVDSTARRQLTTAEGASPPPLEELLKVGRQVLAEAIDAFDPTRGGSFDSFLTFTLMRRFASRAGPTSPPARPTAPPSVPPAPTAGAPAAPRARRRRASSEPPPA